MRTNNCIKERPVTLAVDRLVAFLGPHTLSPPLPHLERGAMLPGTYLSVVSRIITLAKRLCRLLAETKRYQRN